MLSAEAGKGQNMIEGSLREQIFYIFKGERFSTWQEHWNRSRNSSKLCTFLLGSDLWYKECIFCLIIRFSTLTSFWTWLSIFLPWPSSYHSWTLSGVMINKVTGHGMSGIKGSSLIALPDKGENESQSMEMIHPKTQGYLVVVDVPRPMPGLFAHVL